MKIRPSIRTYFLVAMLLTGTVTIGVLTATAVNYFFSGMDMAMTGLLRSQAMELPLGDNDSPLQTNDLTIAVKWQDLPEQIIANFIEDELIPNELFKIIDGIPVIAPPKYGYFVMKVVEGDKVRYAALVLDHLSDNEKFNGEIPPFFYIILTGFAAIIFFALVLIAVQRKIASPVERLRNWAKELDKDQLTQSIPNFHYTELNALAEIIRTSLSSVQESLEREQRFLGYASHELRTPIAVTRTNTELLRKMISKQISVDKQLEVLARIERAGFTMADLTETLLWLNRQEGKSLPSQAVKIGELTKQVESELHYLMRGKSVEVNLSVDEAKVELPKGLCRIVITNLVRNAFQHTHRGEVDITQVDRKLSIVNHNNGEQTENDELGFGLGLELTKKLIEHHGWHYKTTQDEQVWKVEVIFNC